MSVQRENIADKNDKNDDATNQVVDNMENYEEGDIHQSFQVLSEMYVRRTYISVAWRGAPFLFVTKCLLRNTLRDTLLMNQFSALSLVSFLLDPESFSVL